MLSFFKTKKRADRSRALKFFQVLHPLDTVYENDLNGVPTTDPNVQSELNRMVDLACTGVSAATLQAMLLPSCRNHRDPFVQGYVFGCLDASKKILWGVEDFNRSFFHCGFLSYFKSMEAADAALMDAGAAISEQEKTFMQALGIGFADTVKMLQKKGHPSGLADHFNGNY